MKNNSAEKKIPIYLKIYEDLKNKIEKNEYPENSKLPSIRQLALKYKLNNITIMKAFTLLEKEGYIIKKRGIGIFVKSKESLFYNTPSNNLIETFKVGQLKQNNLINFASGTPSEDVYPFPIFKKLYNDVLEKDGPKIMLYHPTQGLDELREVIKKTVEDKGILISKDDIQITSGSQQGLDLILKTLSSKRKNKIVVGNPTYHGALNTFKTNCKIYPVEMEEDGFNLTQLEEILSKEKISFIYTTMDFSCPTGVSWSEEKKQKLILLAKKYNTLIVEDDFASELSFYNSPRTSIKSLDSDNKTVIYIKSFSKIIMPGLRLAYMIAPTELISKIVTVKFTTDISTSALDQKVLANFLKGNFLKLHIENLIKIYKERYLVLTEKLKEIPFLDVIYNIDGGFYVWIKLNDTIDSSQFYLKCKENNILLLSGNVFFLDNQKNQYFRLSFATTDILEIIDGINRLKEIFS
ncbi:PLP-dependent aminotransferase family protein [uncultured Cetobacterium sp.]|uniref:MocR-like pyridoxine biosynthesis transcription factor PdxR n=1 Tax=uncultured Cetobacterium sp. TaxID=527638 RepID=UPI00260011E8|nr:PLP-dependent aminotransferase family protein [uncultured Cetobacterium sp.]